MRVNFLIARETISIPAISQSCRTIPVFLEPVICNTIVYERYAISLSSVEKQGGYVIVHMLYSQSIYKLIPTNFVALQKLHSIKNSFQAFSNCWRMDFDLSFSEERFRN